MTAGEELIEQDVDPAAVGLILETLAALVLDDVALVVELLDVGDVEQRRQAIGFEPEERLEVAGRDGREVVRAVVVGRAVDAALLKVGAEPSRRR